MYDSKRSSEILLILFHTFKFIVLQKMVKIVTLSAQSEILALNDLSNGRSSGY